MIDISAIYQGKLSTLDQVKVSPMSRAYTFSDSIYEVIPYFLGKPLCFKEHFDRMTESVNQMNMNVDWQWIIFKYNWKDLKIGLDMSYNYDIKLVPVTSQRWTDNDPLKPPQEVIECNNIEDIFSLIEDQNDKKTSTQMYS